MRSSRVMVFCGLILIILGIYIYFIDSPDKRSILNFISPLTGILLILLSIPAEKNKIFAVILAAVLTFVSFMFFFYTGLRENNRISIISGVVSVVCLIFFISDIVNKKDSEQ